MIKVSVEVGSDSARLTVTVRAESIRQALEIVEDRYPGDDVRLVHPIDLEAFFVKDPAVAAGTTEPETALIVVELSEAC